MKEKILIIEDDPLIRNELKTLVEWTEDNKIKALKEFGCNRNTYNPYQEGDTPQFRVEKANWF